MAKVEANAHAYGDLGNTVWVAPKGTTAPVDFAAPAAGYADVGWISEDGIEEGMDVKSETFRAWQGATVVRKSITSVDRSFKFSCLEENAVTQGLKYRGKAPVTGTTTQTITVKDQTVTDERAWVIDLLDGTYQKRYVIPRGFYEITGSQKYAAGEMTVLEVTVTPIGDFTEVTPKPAA